MSALSDAILYKRTQFGVQQQMMTSEQRRDYWKKKMAPLVAAGVFGISFIPVTAFIALCLLGLWWWWLSLTKRWFGLANILIFTWMCTFAMPAELNKVIVTMVVISLLVWSVYFHKVTFGRRFIAGSSRTLTIGGKTVTVGYPSFTFFYPVYSLRPFWKRKAHADSRSVRHLKKELLIFFMQVPYWKNENPLKKFAITQNAEGIHQVDFTIPVGWIDSDFVRKAAPEIEAGLHLRSVIPLDMDSRAGFVTLLLCEGNPLEAHLEGADAPILSLTAQQQADPYHWLPVGIDSNGQPFEMPLYLEEGGSVRYLVSGASGAGKSSGVRQQLLQVCMNPNIDVVISDGKGSEFGLFAPYAISYMAFSTEAIDGFMAQIELLEGEISRRANILAENKLTQTNRFSSSWNIYDDGSMLCWVLDEIGVIVGGLSKGDWDKVQNRIYGIASVARSLGVAIIFSSQTWKADLLKTQTRDNCFDVGIGFRLENSQESSYIGFDSNDPLAPHAIGGKILKSGRWSTVGQFATRGLRKDRGKTFFISDSQIMESLKTIPTVNDIQADAAWDEDLRVNIFGKDV